MPFSQPPRWYFSDRGEEKQFQLQHGSKGVLLDLAIAAFGLLAHMAALAQVYIPARFTCTAYIVEAAAATVHYDLWLTSYQLLAVPLLFIVLGWRLYILNRGVFSVLHRLLLATGLGLITGPNHCRYCAALWRHRLLPAHAAFIIGPVPAQWYWIGAIICWLTATFVDAADPQGSCEPSMPCLAAILRGSISSAAAAAAVHPFLQVQNITTVLCSSSSLKHLADVVLPGLVLSYLELSARKACKPNWAAGHAQQQQLQIQAEPIQASASYAAAQSAVDSVHRKADGSGESSTRQKASAACAGKTVAGRTRGLVQQARRAFQQLNINNGHTQHSKDEHLQPHQHAAPPASHLLAATSSTSCSAAAPVKPGVLATAAATPIAESTAAAAEWADAAAPAAPPTPLLPLPGTIAPAPPTPTASDAAQHLATIEETAPAPSAATPLAVLLHDGSPRSAVYNSPLDAMLVSFKLKHPEYVDPSEYSVITRQFADSFQSQLNAAAAAAASSYGSVPACLVTQCTAFPGCYQMVFQAVFCRGSTDVTEGENIAALSAEQQHELQLQLQQMAQQILQSWPEWGLMDVQQLQGSASAGSAAAEATAAAPVVSSVLLPPTGHVSIPCTSEAGTTAAVPQPFSIHPVTDTGLHLQPVALVLPEQPSLFAFEQVSSGSGHQMGESSLSAEASAAAAGTVKLHVPSYVVQQLLQLGCHCLRVVVAQQPMGTLLLDQIWDLPASAAAAAAPAGAQNMQLHLRLGGALRPVDFKEPVVLSVVVLAGEGSTPATTPARAATERAAERPASQVLTQLPLLVLPSGAQNEVQQLFHTAVDDGLAPSDAYQELLPLLRDWAVLLQLYSSSSSTGFRPASTATAMQVYETLADAISACFVCHGMHECLRLQLLWQEQHQQSELQDQQQPRVHDSAGTVSGDGDDNKLARMGSAVEPTLATVLEAGAPIIGHSASAPPASSSMYEVEPALRTWTA